MALIVQKYGGASLKNIERIRQVARRIVATRRAGNRVVVVVSAMGDTTDNLSRLARAITPNPNPRELDMLLTAGERQTIALISIAIMSLGGEAVSFTGSQVGIITDRFHADARIQEVRGERLKEALRRDKIPIVAGFQGVSYDKEITTLGRGGSDVTAVALAAFLHAERCELFKDVDGLFTENPQEFPGVKPIPIISFEELAELAGSGSEIIHPRACALAEKYGVPLVIRSSFNHKRGTMVKKLERLEKAFVRALTHQHRLVRLTLIDVKKRQRCWHQVVTRLAAARVPVVFFNHGVAHGDRFDLSFIVPESHLPQAQIILERVARTVKAPSLEVRDDICSVSLVGPGVGTDPEIMSDAFDALHQAGVHLDAFSSSATRLSCFVNRTDLRLATAALLARFRLRAK
ncbi:MAG: aspartate kinase [candidate division WOR-3 bacterium]